MLDECWAWCQEAVGAGRSVVITPATAYAWLLNPHEVVEWFETMLADPTLRLNHSLIVPGNLAEIVSGIRGPRAALAVLNAAAQRFIGQPGAVSAWIRGSQIDFLTQVGELSRAIENTEFAMQA
jgi:hypothetical protein